jgi:hypothetical protein
MIALKINITTSASLPLYVLINIINTIYKDTSAVFIELSFYLSELLL